MRQAEVRGEKGSQLALANMGACTDEDELMLWTACQQIVSSNKSLLEAELTGWAKGPTEI
jgi:hypothetical protein